MFFSALSVTRKYLSDTQSVKSQFVAIFVSVIVIALCLFAEWAWSKILRTIKERN